MGVIHKREILMKRNVGLIAAGAESAVSVEPLKEIAKKTTIDPREINLCGGLDFSRLPEKNLGPVSKPRTRTFQIIVRQSALNKVHTHGDKTPDIEVCGVMVGDVYHDEAGPFLLIEDIIIGKAAKGSVGQVTFTSDTWQQIQTDMDANHPKKRIVGWYHTHPGHGIFLSDMDLFLHDNFFSMPWQAALVYDPQQVEDGMFGWHLGGADRSNYLVEADEAPTAYGPKDAKVRQKVEVMQPQAEPAAPAATAAIKPQTTLQAIVAAEERCGPHPVTRAFLAAMSLGLFIVMGYLLGNFIIDLHIKLPPFPFHLPFFNR
jgi:proteasome lid subunit RPN8/RPN11